MFLRVLIKLLRKLGFQINWNKVVDPCQNSTFLGVEINSNDMELRLSADKLQSTREELLQFLKHTESDV